MATVIPDGFEPLFRSSPFLDLLGPLYCLRHEGSLILGLHAQDKHCNGRGTVHGGVFSSIADVALGYNAALGRETPVPMVTASLSIDYAGAARSGDWIEVHSDVQRVGRRMAYANCYFLVNGVRIVRASGVFSVTAVAASPNEG